MAATPARALAGWIPCVLFSLPTLDTQSGEDVSHWQRLVMCRHNVPTIREAGKVSSQGFSFFSASQTPSHKVEDSSNKGRRM